MGCCCIILSVLSSCLNQITIRYFRKRMTLKFPVNFSDSETVFVGFESYEAKSFNIKVMLMDRGVQAVPVVLQNSTQTPWYGTVK